MRQFKCSICGYEYDPSEGDSDGKVEPGIMFEDLPGSWRCPVCSAAKGAFFDPSENGSGVPASDRAILEEMHGLEGHEEAAYKERFDNLSRVVRRITSSLSIGYVLENIRDQAKISVPNAQEACLLLFDPEAVHYARPLHCAVYKERINCQLCKRRSESVEKLFRKATDNQQGDVGNTIMSFESDLPAEGSREIALSIHDGKELFGVLDVIAQDGKGFSQRDIVLLKDLAALATNAITNARRHWKMAKEKHTLDSILAHLKPFVPETVHRIVEKDPFDPSMKKRDIDVSVLFLDIAGYSKMSESLSRENVGFVIEKYFSSYLDVIYKWGGDINETAGDGLMVIFQGEAKENALSASRSALDIRRKTQEINEELAGRFEPVYVNMGINSGEVSLGMTQFHGKTGTRMTFTATGPVTNLAARIASAATDGDILVGHETGNRIETEIPLHDRGAQRFKNVKGEHRVFSLVRPA